MSRVGVLIPTYNEAENLAPLVAEIRRSLPEAQVWILDDASPDGTGALADQLAWADPEGVRVLHRPAKEGLGKAYRDGFRAVLKTDLQRFVQMDADFSHPPEVLPRLVAALDRVDLALGSRYVPGGGTEGWSLLRREISRSGNRYARAVLGGPVKDLTGGFKAYRRCVLENYLTIPASSTGYGFQIEFTALALASGFTWEEVPFVFPDRKAGASKMSPGIAAEAFVNVLRLRKRLRGRLKKT
jgi:dolichol-phosphate mannosyltransferase